MNKKAILEGMLFVLGDDGATISQIKDTLSATDDEVKELISSLKTDYESPDRGIQISILGDRLKLTTKREHREYYQKLLENPESNTLSNSALETLAIIAYNSPITRLEVDKIRGVSSAQMIRKLVAKGLIKEVGRSNIPGRPIMYSTTSEFLDFFGLSSIEELPKIDLVPNDNADASSEVDLYKSKYTDDDIEVLAEEENK